MTFTERIKTMTMILSVMMLMTMVVVVEMMSIRSMQTNLCKAMLCLLIWHVNHSENLHRNAFAYWPMTCRLFIFYAPMLANLGLPNLGYNYLLDSCLSRWLYYVLPWHAALSLRVSCRCVTIVPEMVVESKPGHYWGDHDGYRRYCAALLSVITPYCIRWNNDQPMAKKKTAILRSKKMVLLSNAVFGGKISRCGMQNQPNGYVTLSCGCCPSSTFGRIVLFGMSKPGSFALRQR